MDIKPNCEMAYFRFISIWRQISPFAERNVPSDEALLKIKDNVRHKRTADLHTVL